ncbi:MAG: ABC transporter ATP-binding protein [Anaerolineaceae bacterium]|jgi:iron complex transport system ATP-binding protein
MTPGILQAKAINFTYASATQAALKEISFDIYPSSVTAILGPNGAGKTTLLHLLLGLNRPATGTILLNDISIDQYSRHELSQQIGLVPQSEYVPFAYSVMEFVVLGRAPYLGPLELPGEADIDIARGAMQEVGISHLEERAIPELSGGELQLVLLARALCQQPRILLLDEPTSHLDLANRNITLKILDRLRTNGTTIIFSTHDPEAAALIADHLVLMRAGEVLNSGSLEQVFTSEMLSRVYGTPVEVVSVNGMRVVKSMERLEA